MERNIFQKLKLVFITLSKNNYNYIIIIILMYYKYYSNIAQIILLAIE